MKKDITWQESDVHLDKNNSNSNDNDYGDYNLLFAPPPEEDEFEIFDYDYPQLKQYKSSNNQLIQLVESLQKNINDTDYDNKSHVIRLRGHSEMNNSTGLALWLGSETLCEYLLDHPELIHGKRVMELGAGMGLCGITCCYLGAKKVLITDGDSSVLSNLRHNVRQNIPSVFCDDTIIRNAEESESGCMSDRRSLTRDTNNNDHGEDEDLQGPSRRQHLVSCPQLIWGRDIETFAKDYGKSNVIIATDCVYITQSLEPLWQSVDELLIKSTDLEHQSTKEHDDDDDDDDTNNNLNCFLYTNRCASAAPIGMVLEMATKYGFTWSIVQSGDCNSSDNKEDVDGIYLFRRNL